MRFDDFFIKETLPTASIVCGSLQTETFCAVDSRNVVPGDLFVALEGRGCDGHDFVAEALMRGAIGVIVTHQKKEKVLASLSTAQKKYVVVIAVQDTKEALIALATAWRKQFSYPVVGITGSVGKTMTRAILESICIQSGKQIVATYDNANTVVRVALDILRMREHHSVAIIEMGVEERGDMDQMVDIVRPTTALIISVGHCHMEGLGSLNDIALEKRRIFKHFTDASVGIVNGDQPLLASVAYSHPVIKFGSKTTNQIQARKVRILGSHSNFILKLYRKKHAISYSSSHTGMINNILAAAAVAYQLGIPDEVTVRATQSMPKMTGRFEYRTMKQSGGLLIHDAYSAHPESMKLALLAFQQVAAKAHKVAVIGDMTGLGITSSFWHRQVGRLLGRIPTLRSVILVGTQVHCTEQTMPGSIETVRVSTWYDAAQCLEKMVNAQSVVLVKGARSLCLDKLVDHIAPE